MPVLAIDLGTSNTVGVVMDRGKYRIVEVDGSHLLHCDLQGFLYLLVFTAPFLISCIHNPYGGY